MAFSSPCRNSATKEGVKRERSALLSIPTTFFAVQDKRIAPGPQPDSLISRPGILSLILTMLRDDAGDMQSGASDEFGRNGLLVNSSTLPISNADIRYALNLSAWYPSFSTWDPTSGTTPVSPIAPCTQVGWGVVNMSNVMPMYEHLAGISELPSRPADVVACMNANQDIREAYWS